MSGEPRVSLEQLDLNLLRLFEAVYRERNLTRVARQLNVSQSAVSHALGRLRGQLGDELFVRRGAGVEATATAHRLAPALGAGLRLLREALAPRAFDATRDLGRVVLALPDEVETAMLPPIAAALLTAAPGVELTSVRLDRPSVSRDLASGRLDGAIDVVRATGPELRQEPLARDQLCVLSRKRRALDPARYLAAQHVSVSSRPSGPSLEDLALSQLGVARSVVVRCQRYEAACRIVAESALLLTAPRLTTREIAARLGLVLLPVPFALPPVELRLSWHRQAEDDPRSRWIRALIRSAGAEAGWKGRFSAP